MLNIIAEWEQDMRRAEERAVSLAFVNATPTAPLPLRQKAKSIWEWLHSQLTVHYAPAALSQFPLVCEAPADENLAPCPGFPYPESDMDVQLTPGQKAFARRAIESGRLHSEEDAVQQALALWEERERQRAEFLLTLDDARAAIKRGEGRGITDEAMKQLAHDVKERGRARLAIELAPPR